MEIMENKQTGKLFKYEYIECHGIYNVTIHNKTDKNRPLGRCVVIRPLTPTPPVILDFVIYSQAHRRKGFGTDLMNFVKHVFAGGIKSWFYSKPGKEFAYKTGWKEVKSEKGSYLYYSEEGRNELPKIKLYDANNKILDQEEKKEEKVQKLSTNNRKEKKVKDAKGDGEKIKSASKKEGV